MQALVVAMLLLQPSPVQLAIQPPPGHPPVLVDQAAQTANGLYAQGDARTLVGKIAVISGLLFAAVGVALLADPTNCDFTDKDREALRGLTDRERCRVVGGVATGVGAIAGGIGAYLWVSGESMKEEAGKLRRGAQPTLQIGPTGATAGVLWRF